MMDDSAAMAYGSLDELGADYGQPVPVTLSPELIGLLSDQLYRSPSKAVEELVVNAFDADANEARVFVPTEPHQPSRVLVFDDGVGMDYDGLVDLWRVGRPKSRDEMLARHSQRKQIGKFGIGKLATYAIASQVTYVTRSDAEIFAVTIDFREFVTGNGAAPTKVDLNVRVLPQLEDLMVTEPWSGIFECLDLDVQHMTGLDSWTLVVLERLKPKFAELRLGRLRRVLRTAMPLQLDFELSLNGFLVESSKEAYEKVVQFEICDLPQWRLDAIRDRSGRIWQVDSGVLTCDVFPTGVSGEAFVTEQTLLGKSADLLRSEGFFIFVRGRLVNEDDSRFGLHELSHATLNRFRANVHADDLDDVLTANRESIGYADSYEAIQLLLNETFNEARQRFSEWQQGREDNQRGRSETTRDPVPVQLVEHPTADALVDYAHARAGADPDESWMYLAVNSDTDVDEMAQALYADDSDTRPYRYAYTSRGEPAPLVAFDPVESTFTINQDHALMRAYGNDAGSQRLFQDFVTAEALLEVYLLEGGVTAHVVGQILQKRDRLLRSLANAHMSSVAEIAQYLTDSADSSLDLEIALVTGARALGFVAMHIGGSGEPDGLARFMDYPGGERKIILEAKSSNSVPPAKDIDFASLVTHRDRHGASGVLLLAPGYMGDGAANTATAARRDSVSCWTVEQFAKVVAFAEKRHLSARQVLEIVERAFAPEDVAREVESLLGDPAWASAELYAEVVRVLGNMGDILPGSRRTVAMIAPDIARQSDFEGIGESDIFSAVSDLAGASQGGLVLRENGEIVLNVQHEELTRRVSSLTRDAGTPRRRGSFSES